MTTGFVAVLALVAMTAVAPGCGGGSDEPETLTKSAFVTEANAICASAEEDRKQDSEDLSSDDDLDGAEEEAAATEALASPVVTMTEELSELGPPKGDTGQVRAIIAAFEDGIAGLEGESVGPELFSAFTQANELALAYGLTDCRV